MYSFAALLLATLVEISQLSSTIEFVATFFLVIYFAMAIISYMVQGFLKKTENQYINAPPIVDLFMWSLIIAEIGGFCVLLFGAVTAIFYITAARQNTDPHIFALLHLDTGAPYASLTWVSWLALPPTCQPTLATLIRIIATQAKPIVIGKKFHGKRKWIKDPISSLCLPIVVSSTFRSNAAIA